MLFSFTVRVFSKAAWSTPHAYFWLDPNIPPSDEKRRTALFKNGETWYARLLKLPGQPLLKVGGVANTETNKNKLWLIGFKPETHEIWLRLKTHRCFAVCCVNLELFRVCACSMPYHMDISGGTPTDIEKLSNLRFTSQIFEPRQEKKLLELREWVFHPPRGTVAVP
jgi:hypothetical protein